MDMQACLLGTVDARERESLYVSRCLGSGRDLIRRLPASVLAGQGPGSYGVLSHKG